MIKIRVDLWNGTSYDRKYISSHGGKALTETTGKQLLAKLAWENPGIKVSFVKEELTSLTGYTFDSDFEEESEDTPAPKRRRK